MLYQLANQDVKIILRALAGLSTEKGDISEVYTREALEKMAQESGNGLAAHILTSAECRNRTVIEEQ